MSKTKYTKEKCKEIALTCKTRNELKKKCYMAYKISLKEGYMDEYDWFIDGNKLAWQKKTIPIEECIKIASNCNTKVELKKKHPGAYKRLCQEGLINTIHFEDGRKLAGLKKTKYTEKYCRELARGCKTLKEFYTKYPKTYQVSLKNEWLNSYDWLKRELPLDERKNDNVYAYVFPNAVYVGRTVNKYERNIQHHKKGAVFNYSQEHNVSIPEMTILKTDITKDEGLYWEDFYVKKFRSDGWIVLNKAQTGPNGALGKIGERLSEKKCREIMEKCKTRKELYDNYPAVYKKVRKKGWINDYEHLVSYSVYKRRA